MAVTVPAHLLAPIDDAPLENGDGLLEYFSRGQCHAFAIALHNLTGWRFVGCAYDMTPIPCHIMVVRPDGKSVDVFGAHAPGKHPDHIPLDWQPMQVHEIYELVSDEDYDVIDMATAERYAPLLLTLLDSTNDCERLANMVVEAAYCLS